MRIYHMECGSVTIHVVLTSMMTNSAKSWGSLCLPLLNFDRFIRSFFPCNAHVRIIFHKTLIYNVKHCKM